MQPGCQNWQSLIAPVHATLHHVSILCKLGRHEKLDIRILLLATMDITSTSNRGYSRGELLQALQMHAISGLKDCQAGMRSKCAFTLGMHQKQTSTSGRRLAGMKSPYTFFWQGAGKL